MKIETMKIREYLDMLGSDAPAPGGGSVSAVTAAQGAALNLMVLDLTKGKEKYKEYEEHNSEAERKCRKLFEELASDADKDKEAFTVLSEAYRIPKDDPERKNKIGEASLGATEVPFRLMEKCMEGVEITQSLTGKTNKMASSDLGVAALCFDCACRSAWLNVKINIPYLTDEEKKNEYIGKGAEILEKCRIIADKVYKEVEMNL